jgi:chromosome segregation ATPase
MNHPSVNLRKKLSELRVESSKKKVKASKHYLKCRVLEEKCTNDSMRVTDLEVDRQKLVKRRQYFESKIDELESKISGNGPPQLLKKEIEQRRRKIADIQNDINACEEKIAEERKDIEKMRKKAEEQLRKSEEATREAKEIEMEAVKIEIKLGIKK